MNNYMSKEKLKSAGPPLGGATRLRGILCSLVQKPSSPVVVFQKPSSPEIVCFKSLIHPKGQPGCFLPAARNRELPPFFSVPSIPGPPQNSLKNHLRNRCPKALNNYPRASKIVYKNQARGPPAGISDAILSNPDFKGPLHEFHGFSCSRAS